MFISSWFILQNVVPPICSVRIQKKQLYRIINATIHTNSEYLSLISSILAISPLCVQFWQMSAVIVVWRILWVLPESHYGTIANIHAFVVYKNVRMVADIH